MPRQFVEEAKNPIQIKMSGKRSKNILKANFSCKRLEGKFINFISLETDFLSFARQTQECECGLSSRCEHFGRSLCQRLMTFPLPNVILILPSSFTLFLLAHRNYYSWRAPTKPVKVNDTQKFLNLFLSTLSVPPHFWKGL